MRIPLLVGALVLGTGFAFCADPFFLFGATQDKGVYPVLEQYFGANDYVGRELANVDPKLRQRIERAHQFDVGLSLAEVQTAVTKGCGSGSAGLVVYNWSTTQRTPPAEQANPAQSLNQAATIIRSAACYQSMALPGEELFGYEGNCRFNLDAGTYRQVDWKAIDLVDIQGEMLLFDGCIAQSGIVNYVKLATQLAGYLRSQNPKIQVVAQLSFRATPPPVLAQAMDALKGAVDGFLLSYPLNPQMEHKYSLPQDLAAFLSAVRPRSSIP